MPGHNDHNEGGKSFLLYGENPVQIWGMSNATRTRRLVDKLDGAIAGQLWVNLDYVFDPQWMRYVQDNPDTVLTINNIPVLAHITDESTAAQLENMQLPSGLTVIEYQNEPRIHNHALRKLDTPFAEKLTANTVKAIERQSYFGAYKA